MPQVSYTSSSTIMAPVPSSHPNAYFPPRGPAMPRPALFHPSTTHGPAAAGVAPFSHATQWQYQYTQPATSSTIAMAPSYPNTYFPPREPSMPHAEPIHLNAMHGPATAGVATFGYAMQSQNTQPFGYSTPPTYPGLPVAAPFPAPSSSNVHAGHLDAMHGHNHTDTNHGHLMAPPNVHPFGPQQQTWYDGSITSFAPSASALADGAIAEDDLAPPDGFVTPGSISVNVSTPASYTPRNPDYEPAIDEYMARFSAQGACLLSGIRLKLT